VVDAIIPVIEDKMDTQFAAFEQRMDTRFTDHMTELESYYSNHYGEIIEELRALRADYQKVFGKSE